jgi:predicted metal-binding membrane protein
MMTAMMLPSAAPLVLLYGPRGRGRLVLGYLLVWAAIGLPVYALASAVDLMDVPAAAVAAVLAAAGVYQLTPLKDVCLRACRSPLDFVALRWGRGALRLGAEHGAYCVGCCWALMAVLVVAAAMSVTAAAVIAAVVFAEKVLPAGEWTARVAGLALLAAAGVALV